MEWKNLIEQAHLTHSKTIFSIYSSILWKIAYPLALTTFNEQQCMEIMCPILQASLPKIGCIQTMPRIVVHAPISLVGLNILNLYMEQLVTQLLMLLQYGSQLEEMMCILIWALAEAMKLESSLAGEVLATPLIFEGLITDTWLKQLWIDLLKYGITIQMDLPDFQPQTFQQY